MIVSTEGMRQYQLDKVDEIVFRSGPRHSLILPYGSGKTWVALASIGRLMKEYDNGERPTDVDPWQSLAIVFCRKHTVDTWRAECHLRGLNDVVSWDELLERDKLSTRKGAKRLAPRVIDKHTIVLVTHPQIAPQQSAIQNWMNKHKPFALIMDESTKIKVPSTLRTKAALTIAERHHGVQLTLTGKMTPEGAHEAWSQIQFTRPHNNPLGSSYYSHLRKWFIQSDRGYALKIDQVENFKATVSSAVSRLDEQQWKDYSKSIGITSTYVTEYFDETEQQLSLVRELFEEWALPSAADPGEETTREQYQYTGSLHTKAQQIANGFYYVGGSDTERAVVRLRLNPKMDRLVEIVRSLNEEKRQAIIWLHFEEDYALVKTRLDQEGLSSTVGPHRVALEGFQRGLDRFIIMPITISEGFNELAVANTAIYFTNVASQEARSQAEARIVRLNQSSPIVTHIDIVGRQSYDRHIVELLRNKSFSPAELSAVINKHRNKLSLTSKAKG